MTLRDKNVDLRLGTEATRERVLAEKPDTVILAVGSEPIIPRVPGVEGGNVCLAQDIDLGRAKPGKRVVIVGAGWTGATARPCGKMANGFSSTAGATTW